MQLLFRITQISQFTMKTDIAIEPRKKCLHERGSSPLPVPEPFIYYCSRRSPPQCYCSPKSEPSACKYVLLHGLNGWLLYTLVCRQSDSAAAEAVDNDSTKNCWKRARHAPSSIHLRRPSIGRRRRQRRRRLRMFGIDVEMWQTETKSITFS